MTEIALYAPAFLIAAANWMRAATAMIVRFFDALSAAGQAHREIERIGNQTDAELSRRGLTRATAIRQVFERSFG